MNDVIIRSDDHSFAYLDCDYGIIREMSDRYTFKPDGYMFTPAYKAGVWNGEIRLVDVRTGRFAKGLVPDIIDSLEASGYNVSLARGDFDSFRETLDMVDVDSLKLGFEPYDYQIAGVKRILEKKRQVILSPTGSGKSLLLYLTVRSLVGKKILIIVPNISLVSQLYSDFEDYAKNDDSWDVADNCQKIAEGASKEVSKNAVISTWQSIYTIKDKRWFEQYEAVFVDECLHPDTLITMATGEQKKISDVTIGEFVKTRNEESGKIEDKEILKVHHNLSVNEQMYEIELETGETVKITGNHKVYTDRGWLRVDELELTDSINSFN